MLKAAAIDNHHTWVEEYANTAYLPSRADTQDFYFWRMPEHDTAIHLNLARSRQEVKCWNN